MAQEKNLNDNLSELEKNYGLVKAKKIKPQEKIRTGIYGLDYVLDGGIQLREGGHKIELYGAESCLIGNTYISYEIRNKSGERQNCKGGTIKHLYERFHHKKIKGKGYYQRTETINSEFFVSSINENNRIIKNKIFDVVKCGIKKCFKIETEKGFFIISTLDHKYYTGNGFKSLKELSIGDVIYVHNNTHFKKERHQIRYKECCVKYHPKWKTKQIGDKYLYYRNRKANAVYEAFLNNMSYNEYIRILNTKNKKEIKKMKFIPKGYDIHHKDKNPLNDKLENLVLIKKSEHYKYHSLKNHNKLRYIVIPDKIKKIIYQGKKETYDIKCFSPYNNYIANNIVVHNSGKTTFALKIVKSMQEAGKKCVWIVSESFNSDWAEQLGVNTEELLLAYPESVEDASELLLTLVPKVDVIIVDSVASLIPKAEIERAMDEPTRGTQAKAYSYMCRKLYPIISHKKTVLLFINQVRVDMNKTYGNPETTPCGKALRHMYDTRINFKAGAPIEDGTKDKKERIGSEIKLFGKKNKVGTPQRKIAIDFYFDGTIDNRKSLLFAGIKYCIIELSGKTYTYKKKKAVGKDNFIKKLTDEDWKNIEEDVWTRIKS